MVSSEFEPDLAISRLMSAPELDFASMVRLVGLDPSRHFRYANLRGVDFSGSSLDGFDFTGADLSECSFENANIRGATFDTGYRFSPAIKAASDYSELIPRVLKRNSKTVDKYLPALRSYSRSVRGSLDSGDEIIRLLRESLSSNAERRQTIASSPKVALFRELELLEREVSPRPEDTQNAISRLPTVCRIGAKVILLKDLIGFDANEVTEILALDSETLATAATAAHRHFLSIWKLEVSIAANSRSDARKIEVAICAAGAKVRTVVWSKEDFLQVYPDERGIFIVEETYLHKLRKKNAGVRLFAVGKSSQPDLRKLPADARYCAWSPVHGSCDEILNNIVVEGLAWTRNLGDPGKR